MLHQLCKKHEKITALKLLIECSLAVANRETYFNIHQKKERDLNDLY